MEARRDPHAWEIRIEAAIRIPHVPLSDVQRLVEDVLRAVREARVGAARLPRQWLGTAAAHLGSGRGAVPAPAQAAAPGQRRLYLVAHQPRGSSG